MIEMLKKSFVLTFTFGLLIASTLACNDKSSSPAKIHSFVDDIREPKIIDSLMLPFAGDDGYRYHVTPLSETNLRFDTIIMPYTISKGIDQMYFKADFDRNGYTDLLVNGGWRYHGSSFPKTFFDPHVIMNFGGSNYSIQSLKRDDPDEFAAAPVYRYGQSMIEIFSARYEGRYRSNKIEKATNLLVYRNGKFVEFNPKPADDDVDIEKIQLAVGPCMGKCTKYQIIISHDGNAYLLWSDNNDPTSKMKIGAYSAPITVSEYNKIGELLRYTDFRRFKANYEVSHTDAPSSLLRITYNGGKVKTVGDYGKAGSYSLVAIYKMLDQLRTKKKWTPIEEPTGVRLKSARYNIY